MRKSKTTKRVIYDPDRMNEKRAAFALSAIYAFQAVTGTDACDAISDLLCDIRHMCDYYRAYGSWDDALDRATRPNCHYEAETSKEG